jgi:hypothetical protein
MLSPTIQCGLSNGTLEAILQLGNISEPTNPTSLTSSDFQLCEMKGELGDIYVLNHFRMRTTTQLQYR